MSLLTLWQSNPIDIGNKHIQQLVKIAGDGALKDGGQASTELREFLAAVPTEVVERYLKQCLDTSFDDSGLVLQDVVNELGERLGCDIDRGLYRGKQNVVGFDGIWRFPGGYSIVVEVKTTDAYNISLEKIAGYRNALIKEGKISENSSVLIVVGRKDTDSLEAQVRGSRHGWDIRLISADKLLKLVEIKEAADNKETIQKIRTVLRPLDLTKVDFIVDLLATTADDIKETVSSDEEAEGAVLSGKKEKKFTPVAFHEEVVSRLQKALSVELKKETRTLYVTPDKVVSARALVSKSHVGGPNKYYWYAFHPYYKDPLNEYKKSYIAFGCGGPEKILLFNLAEFVAWLPKMNITEKEDRVYWHVHFVEDEAGKIELRFKGGQHPTDVTTHLVS
ncbi:hypothetical protein [Sulfuricaulis sp.]|uniref:hypothetical protein n=1 Tax=Sulfuricaulis sp. TaxID=2003553 RepID=UPI00355AB7D3